MVSGQKHARQNCWGEIQQSRRFVTILPIVDSRVTSLPLIEIKDRNKRETSAWSVWLTPSPSGFVPQVLRVWLAPSPAGLYLKCWRVWLATSVGVFGIPIKVGIHNAVAESAHWLAPSLARFDLPQRGFTPKPSVRFATLGFGVKPLWGKSNLARLGASQ